MNQEATSPTSVGLNGVSIPAPQAKLCYVRGCWAYFTTRPLAEQWGDDWNDCPYEHNAGEPYNFGEHAAKRGEEPWDIVRVAWDGPLVEPSEYTNALNSPYSVETINAGAAPWLRTDRWWHKEHLSIPAGTSLADFIPMVNSVGGNVYLAVVS